MEGMDITAQVTTHVLGVEKAAEWCEIYIANMRVQTLHLDDLIHLCIPGWCRLGWIPPSALDVWGEESVP